MANQSCCKVGNVIEEYDLSGNETRGDLNNYLEARWLGEEDYPSAGLRTLAEWLNKRILKQVYTEHGRSTMETRITSEYDALTSEDDIERAEIIDDLAVDEIDGASLVDSFVSKSTVGRHLKNCLDCEKSVGKDSEAESNWEREKVNYSKETIEKNVTEAIQSLENKGRLPGGSIAVSEISVLLHCPECTTRVRFEDALARGYICEEHLGRANAQYSQSKIS